MLTMLILNEVQTRDMYSWIRDNFPDDERRPLQMMLKLMQKGLYEVIGFYNGEIPVGYALSILPKNNPAVLLDYLVVDEWQRGHGLGAKILTMLRIHYASRAAAILIESENPQGAPDSNMAVRRMHFYQRAGGVQLPFRVLLWGVDYTIFALPTGETLPEGHWDEVILEIYRQTLPAVFFRTRVSLIPDKSNESDDLC